MASALYIPALKDGAFRAKWVKIVDAGSITAAAEAQAVSQPAMVRTLAALERDLGVRLLNRTTRRMSLTDEGSEYLARCRQILAALDDAQLSLRARQASPRGRLRIASSVSFGRTFVAPVVAEYLLEHPEITIELVLLDRVVDLVEEGMDVAVRVARLVDSSMVAHGIGEVRRVIVASPELIARVGRPEVPNDLRELRCVSFTGVVGTRHWDFRDGRKEIQIPIRSVLVTNQVDAGVHACIQAVGFGRFLDYHVQAQIHAGQLIRVLKKFESEAVPVNIIFPSSRLQSPNVRSFVRFAQPRLRDRLKAEVSPLR